AGGAQLLAARRDAAAHRPRPFQRTEPAVSGPGRSARLLGAARLRGAGPGTSPAGAVHRHPAAGLPCGGRLPRPAPDLRGRCRPARRPDRRHDSGAAAGAARPAAPAAAFARGHGAAVAGLNFPQTATHTMGVGPLGASAMRLPRFHRLIPALLIALTAAATVASADEGMWTHDNFPAAQVQQRHGVAITPAWLDTVRLSTVRLANCTASFVSAEGLMLTNHHCVAPCLAQLSNAGEDRLRDGFTATSRDAELRCPTQRADVLMKTEDITAQVQAAIAGK